ncbi:MAG: hypothetical protein FWF38_06845, partial [Spirochaetaceae bacterium]|nr:hypothetical protein [Spirochaetaceae bacterium]
ESLLLSAKKDIIDAINRGVEVQIIIAKRGSILLEELWEIEGATQTGRQDDAERVIKEIAEKTKGNGCLFHHKEYNTQVRYALVAVDGKWAWWTPYHPGIRVEETSSFELSDTGYTSIINECIKHFNNLWSKLQ